MADTGKSLGPILTIAEVATALSLSARSVRRLLAPSGPLPCIHLTARRRGILESDVAAYIAERRVVAQPPYTGSRTGIASSKYSELERAYFAACTRRQRAQTETPRRSKRKN